MKKTLIALLTALSLCGPNAYANRILWAALDESSTIDGTAFRDYIDPQGLFVNAARLSIGSSGNYSMDSVVKLALWIPEYTDPDTGETEPAYWEDTYTEQVLKDEYGEYEMGLFGSQYALGDNPNPNATVFFELGYVADWDDYDSPFVTLATAGATISELDAARHIYPTGTLNPPIEANWMPTQFRAVPEPSIAFLALLGAGLLVKRRT